MTGWKPIKTYEDIQHDEFGFGPPVFLWDGKHASVGNLGRAWPYGRRLRVWYALAAGEDAHEYDSGIIVVKPTHWAPIEPPKRRGK